MVSLFLLLGCNLSYIVDLFAALHELASASARTLLKLPSLARALNTLWRHLKSCCRPCLILVACDKVVLCKSALRLMKCDFISTQTFEVDVSIIFVGSFPYFEFLTKINSKVRRR